jgi:hypothetical protein
MAASVGGTPYFFGGFTQQYDVRVTTPEGCIEDGEYFSEFTQDLAPFFNTNQKYDPTADSWTAMQATNSNRGMGGAFAIGQFVFASGGISGQTVAELSATCFDTGAPPTEWPITIYEDEFEFTGRTDRYSSTGDAWSQVASMTCERAGHASAQFETSGYVFGGRTHSIETSEDHALVTSIDGYNQYQTYSSEKYNPTGDAWSSIQDLPGGYPDYTPSFGDLPAAASYDSILVHLYPATESADHVFAKYNPSANSYQMVGSKSALVAANESTWKKGGSIGFIT